MQHPTDALGRKAMCDRGDCLTGAPALKKIGIVLGIFMRNKRAIQAEERPPRSVENPADVKNALAAEPAAEALFSNLSPSHKKEYLEWITSAKKAETRAARVSKLIPMLLEKKDSK